MDEALALGDLTYMGLSGARKHIEATVQDRVLREALLFNLNEDGNFSVNIPAVHANKRAILSF